MKTLIAGALVVCATIVLVAWAISGHVNNKQDADRARAKARGVHMGRPHKLTLFQRAEARARRDAGETLMDIARSYGVSHPTISRL
jgi:helix-turn-helix protein